MHYFQSGTSSVILLICTLLTSNHMTFLVQFGNNLHFMCFSKSSNFTRPKDSCNFNTFQKPTSANYFQTEREKSYYYP